MYNERHSLITRHKNNRRWADIPLKSITLNENEVHFSNMRNETIFDTA